MLNQDSPTPQPMPEDEHAPIPALGGWPSHRNAERLLERACETLCFCYHIPTSTVASIIKKTQTRRVQDVLRRCGAGGGCASCRPDIADLIRAITGQEPDLTFDEDDHKS